MDKDEYELMPISPIRRLEKRLERLETTSTGDVGDVFRHIVDIMKMNQQLVDELAKSNDAMRIELSRLPGKLDELITNLKELLLFVRSSGEEEVVGVTQEAMKPVVDKLDELVKANKVITERNDSMLELLDTISKRLRRSVPPRSAKHLLRQSTQNLRGQRPIKV